jgi:hypothetical protein
MADVSLDVTYSFCRLNAMPLTPQEFYDHARQATGDDGRLPLSRMTGWEVFPFESEGLRVVPLNAPQLPEPPRNGEGGSDCFGCRRGTGAIWSDEHWRVSSLSEPTGAPLVLMLQPREHYDLPTLPDDRATEFGKLIVHIARAIESLPHIARAHVSRWGDGGAHLHVFFYARPEGFSQLRGTCLAVWDDLLPETPSHQWDADAQAVAGILAASYGGRAAAAVNR